MLEINDFNAVRISLASPQQIRSWSYGEVTVPETINYRTLKPEKDGLFSERIFGPTKDFECYCGKYKRVRYKGIICDKCGVEVARAEVRRERMGHIELAAPAAHIWFSKGTPSRLGLLLDLSPRSLERVLYFAQYIVIRTHEEVREQAVKNQEEEALREVERRETEAEEKIGQVAANVEERIAELEAAGEAKGKTQEKIEKKRAAAVKEVTQIQQRLSEEKREVEAELSRRLEDIGGLVPRALLTESRHRELKDRHGKLFDAGMGAEAILDILENIDLDALRQELMGEITSTSGQRRKKASRRLRVVEALRRSANKPEWMILTVLPVLPPELRPMVQLDGGRFAVSDLNDLYRRVINRNNRLARLLELGAPQIIIRNEKRMLQEAVDSLIDNGRRGQPVSGGNQKAKKLKSLSDMLRGKQGRFRQNLLGKRVDYSGRSVIVAGPELKLHQCGLPKRMALELFKPFVMHHLMERGLAHNIKSARRLVERAKPEVWDILEEVIQERSVLLNRAPTLHRLGIQAFEPVLISGSAIQVHPLVCTAFNADFDGDQMAIHVPLSKAAVKEAREIMLSIYNMLLPSSGEPVVAPTLDMVLGCYYLTNVRPGAPGEGKEFVTPDEVRLAYELGIIDLQAEVGVRDLDRAGGHVKTSVGRIIFNEILPLEMGFLNNVIDKAALKGIVANCHQLFGNAETAEVLDNLKTLGFRYATKSGISISMNDIRVPDDKPKLLDESEEKIAVIESQYRRGLITDDERYTSAVAVWNDTTDKFTEVIDRNLDRYGGIYMMANSGAKGNIAQIRQMAGMRGLMTDPSGRIIDFPIRSSFREGLSVLEYFISTHGARKGLADTALRTSDSGYLTRRLVDVAQDVIVMDEDCGTTTGIWLVAPDELAILVPLAERLAGRMAAADVMDPGTGEIIVQRNEEITEEQAESIPAAGITKVLVRSPLSCIARQGICQACYGRDLGRGYTVQTGTAVGIIAAQSIGEPGTQLTMRTFHTGGVVGIDITSGLPRIEELFEARTPKGEAIVSEIDGQAEIITSTEGRRIKITSKETYRDEYPLPPGFEPLVEAKQWVNPGTLLIRPTSSEPAGDGTPSPSSVEEGEAPPSTPMVARVAGQILTESDRLVILFEESEEREYAVPAAARIRIDTKAQVRAGEQLTDGHVNPQDMLRIRGRESVQQYLVEEVQKVYRAQGVNINDKHIEIIVRQMLTKVRVDSSGDTKLLPGELVDRFIYEDINAKVMAEGGEPATAQTVLLGITRASLNTESWLAAASFQETTRVLTETAISGKIDKLLGLKENVIIGKLIPAHRPEIKEPEKDSLFDIAFLPTMEAEAPSDTVVAPAVSSDEPAPEAEAPAEAKASKAPPAEDQ